MLMHITVTLPSHHRHSHITMTITITSALQSRHRHSHITITVTRHSHISITVTSLSHHHHVTSPSHHHHSHITITSPSQSHHYHHHHHSHITISVTWPSQPHHHFSPISFHRLVIWASSSASQSTFPGLADAFATANSTNDSKDWQKVHYHLSVLSQAIEGAAHTLTDVIWSSRGNRRRGHLLHLTTLAGGHLDSSLGELNQQPSDQEHNSLITRPPAGKKKKNRTHCGTV